MKHFWILTLSSLILLGCVDNDRPTPASTPGGGSSQQWLIPQNKVLDGGPGKDGIPAIDNPRFISQSEVATQIDDGELVVVVKSGNQVKAYPHNILDWHEIVNDQFQSDLKLAVTYCPLTGTAVGWNREVDGRATTFGVSGLLYNTNLMPYDRLSESYWSQMLQQSVKGAFVGDSIKRYPVVEMTWRAFQARYPGGQVLSRETGFDRNYGSYPYGSYRSTEGTFFPVDHEDDRLFGKARVHGVQLSGTTRVYPVSLFERGENVINDEMAGEFIVLIGNKADGMVVSFYRPTLDNEMLELSPTDNSSGQVIATDQFGNDWNHFGEAVSGPHEGMQLESTPSYIGFYFAWIAFNGTDVEIYGTETQD